MNDDERNKLALDMSKRDQTMALVRDNIAVIDCYARFFPDDMVRFLAKIALCEQTFWSNENNDVEDDVDADS